MSALIRYESPAVALSDLFDNLFEDSFFSRTGREITGTLWPKVDILEDQAHFTLHADLPGVTRDEVKIEVRDGVLTMSGEKKEEKREHKDGYFHLERGYGRFSRSFALPENVDQNSIEAHMKDGVLSLTLKKTKQPEPRAIEVKVN